MLFWCALVESDWCPGRLVDDITDHQQILAAFIKENSIVGRAASERIADDIMNQITLQHGAGHRFSGVNAAAIAEFLHHIMDVVPTDKSVGTIGRHVAGRDDAMIWKVAEEIVGNQRRMCVLRIDSNTSIESYAHVLDPIITDLIIPNRSCASGLRGKYHNSIAASVGYPIAGNQVALTAFCQPKGVFPETV